MSRTTKILILAGVVLLFIVLLYFFGVSKEETYISDNWEETYDPDDKGPYGTYMLKELLDTAGLFGNFLELNKKLPEVLEDQEDVNDIYFFVGQVNHMNEEYSVNYLLDFVAGGNTAFMACESFPWELLDQLGDSDSIAPGEAVTDSVQHFRFTHPDLAAKRYSSTFIYNNRVAEREWYYLNEKAFDLQDEDTVYALGSNTRDQVNFVKIRYGDGFIFLHSTPYLFTNISLMKRNGFQYAEKVLEHIPPGRIQWDRYNLNFHWSFDGEGDGTGGEERKSILQFILKHPPLFWATMILLIGGILYALFKGKRMQRIIPAAELKENTSLGYITTLSSLYQQESQHHKLIRLKEKTFLNFIAERYFISVKEPNDAFFEKVAVKSQVEKEKIADIFRSFHELERIQNVTDDELISLHKKIEYFYKKCR